MLSRKSLVNLFKLMNEHNLNAEEAIVATLVKDSHPSYEIYPLMDHLQFSTMMPKVGQMLINLQRKGVIVTPISDSPCDGCRIKKHQNNRKHHH